MKTKPAERNDKEGQEDLDELEQLKEDARAFARGARTTRGDDVQEAAEESFPASDPPSFTPATSIGPKNGSDKE